MLTDSIIAQIKSVGYHVTIHRVNGTVEMHAIPLVGGDAQIARCEDGDGPDEDYRCACLLAQAVGIELEG